MVVVSHRPLLHRAFKTVHRCCHRQTRRIHKKMEPKCTKNSNFREDARSTRDAQVTLQDVRVKLYLFVELMFPLDLARLVNVPKSVLPDPHTLPTEIALLAELAAPPGPDEVVDRETLDLLALYCRLLG